MDDMTIRRATAADIPQIDELLRQVLEVHHAGRPDLFKGGVKKYTDEELKAILTNDQTPVLRHLPMTALTPNITPTPPPPTKCLATHSACSSSTSTAIS